MKVMRVNRYAEAASRIERCSLVHHQDLLFVRAIVTACGQGLTYILSPILPHTSDGDIYQSPSTTGACSSSTSVPV